MKFIIILASLHFGVLAASPTALAATCTITKYDKDNIDNAAKDCSDLTLDGINVPAGVTLVVNLKQGAKLTFKGTLTWEYKEWSGPLFNISGTDVEIVGAKDHVLDVKGNLWWDGKGEHGGKIKPVSFVFQRLKNSVIRNITIKNTPFHAIWIEHSDGVVTQDVYVNNKDGDALGISTDGINVWTSNNVTIQRLTVYNQDDCVAIKSGTNILVTDSYCSGGHGLSIGSVGSRDYNIVENVTVSNSQIIESDNGIRIKTGYGVTGSVTNVTYENITLRDINKFGIIIEGDYNIETGSPTGVATDGVPIKHFILRNITGTVKKSGVNIYVLVKNATDWHWSDIDVTGGEQTKECDGIPEGSDISC
ncbi:hypothetical protein NQ315_014132 [Exocentrus adspersus]|uniref:endo-polygalacturonase n=1 Tax=Exocentrus adspersus TaxID=1586481 RepID=A0AAV8VWK3_9CUCU|nr:hypothetical protein NQ315_014132 [Exocentrus adspersus]